MAYNRGRIGGEGPFSRSSLTVIHHRRIWILLFLDDFLSEVTKTLILMTLLLDLQ